jgi:uncharacterized repeat protein (TIGR02543 family)
VVAPDDTITPSLLDFRFTKSSNQFSSIIDEAVGVIDYRMGTVIVVVPNGTDIGSLIPTLTVNEGCIYTPEGVNDFTSAKNYRVEVVAGQPGAGDFTDYTVTVVEQQSNSADILGFGFMAGGDNPTLRESVSGVIDEVQKTISVVMPWGTNLSTALKPVITHSGGSTTPGNLAPQYFSNSGSNPITYTVTALDRITQAEYAVMVTVDPTPPDYTITFFTHGGSAVDPITEPAGTEVAKPLPDPVLTGYTFSEWFDASSGGNEITWAFTLTENTTIHARWTPVSSAISFSMNGGTGSQDGVSATYDAAMPSISNVCASRSGYNFAGYYDAASGGVQYYTASGASARIWDKDTSSQTLYAQWTLAQSMVSYYGNGSESGAVPSPQTVSAGTVTISGNTGALTKAGYNFNGWNTAGDGSGASYSPGAPYGMTGSLDLYAQWTLITCSYALTALQAIYTDDTVNQIEDFNSDVVDYYFVTDEPHIGATANIVARASSPGAAVSIKMRGGAALVSGTGLAFTTITLPTQAQYAYVEVTVTSAPGTPEVEAGSRTYTITILGYDNLVEWTATVSNPPYPITALTMFDRSNPQIAIKMIDQGSGTVFKVKTLPAYAAATFVVSMSNNGVSYSTKAMSPPSDQLSNKNVILDLTGVPKGRTISNVPELLALSDDDKKAESWSVIADIVLPNTGTWTGPTGFSGKFYGNGHTISNLKFAEAKGSMGLFNSLGAAELYDLTIEVPYTTAAIPMTSTSGPTYFGAVVGSGGGNAKIHGVKVIGGLHLGPQSGGTHFVCGGFFGQTGGALIFENCASDMTISIDTTNLDSASANPMDIGGFIGLKWGGNASFTNCYSAGKIDAKLVQVTHSQFKGTVVGGFVSAGSGGTITITNCYSAVEIDSAVKIINDAANKNNIVGGFVGYTYTMSVPILNTLALNPHVRASSTGTGLSTISAGRVIGLEGTGTLNYSGLYALGTMSLQAEGSNVELSAATTTGKDGASTADGTGGGELRNQAFWESLGFSATNWDFTPLSNNGWPVLK